MVVSIGAVASASQSVFYYEKDGYYARDDPAHREASSWAGKGAADLGLEGPVDPEVFRSVLEGEVPNGSGHRLRWPPRAANEHVESRARQSPAWNVRRCLLYGGRVVLA